MVIKSDASRLVTPNSKWIARIERRLKLGALDLNRRSLARLLQLRIHRCAAFQAGGSSRLAWNSAKYLANIASVSVTSVKPACISLMVETIAGGPGSFRP